MTINIITLENIKKTIAETLGKQENEIDMQKIPGKTNLIFLSLIHI